MSTPWRGVVFFMTALNEFSKMDPTPLHRMAGMKLQPLPAPEFERSVRIGSGLSLFSAVAPILPLLEGSVDEAAIGVILQAHPGIEVLP